MHGESTDYCTYYRSAMRERKPMPVNYHNTVLIAVAILFVVFILVTY